MPVKSPKEYREQARRVRELAEVSTSIEVRAALLDVAATYDDLSLQAARLARLGYQKISD